MCGLWLTLRVSARVYGRFLSEYMSLHFSIYHKVIRRSGDLAPHILKLGIRWK